jgi:LAS superfamily LD-carboxypeptidase LdcB
MPIRTRATTKGESGPNGVKNSPFLGLPQSEQSKEYNYDLGHKNGTANQTMVSLFKKGVWIANNSYKPWVATRFVDNDGDVYYNDSSQSDLLTEFSCTRNEMFEYIKSFVVEWKKLTKKTPENKDDIIKNQLFNTMDNNTIKLNIYRHCKSLYDKWIAGSQGNIMTSCGAGDGLVSKANASKSRKSSSNVRLIDSFRFTNRAFNDLGDDFLLNPKIITDIVLGNPNQSFYDLISRTLADNNFNFIALPSFIDYNSKVEMEALFKPEIYNNDLDKSVSGPTFVCVYVGQGSNKLDLGKGSAFPNDGFDFRCDSEGNLDMSETGLPKDFSKQKATNEHNVVAFAVNYGQQNQNIFTDIKLDQQEFSETDESLQITDSIANQGSQSSRTQAGQNLWNVYQVRSYSTEITAMGNAMIQPMMYFQLNNIPMFHGAYMIINTTHKITPNFMTTTFKGVRTRYVDTPLTDSETLYMSMLGTLSDVEGLASLDRFTSTTTNGSVPPIVQTIIDNGGSNANIDTGNIITKQIPRIDGINNLKLNLPTENVLIQEAVDPLVNMLTDWVAWMKDNGFNGNDGYYAYITSIFRDYNKQVELKKKYGSRAATPGTSNHGWGIAIDIQFTRKDGTLIPNEQNTLSAFNTISNPAIKWLYDNSYIYGFVLPQGIRNGVGLEEHWHFEYHGTAATCLMTNNPTIYGYTVNVNKEQIGVENPKDNSGVRAIYEDCKYRLAKNIGDGTETNIV